jgi:hypothetical protein
MKGPFGAVSEFRVSGTVRSRYCPVLPGMGPPDVLGKPASSQGKGRLFPVLGGGPVSTETPSFYEGKSLFLPLGRASLSSDSDSLTFARPHCGGWSAPVPERGREQVMIRALAVLRLRASGKIRMPLRPLLALAPGRLDRLRLSVEPERLSQETQ